MTLRLGDTAPDFVQDVMIVPSLQDPEVIKKKFPKGYKALRPYLRMTPQPNLDR